MKIIFILLLAAICYCLPAEGRDWGSLNLAATEEETTVRQIAHSNTQAAFDAHTILFLRYGEEYVIPLPEMPAYLNSSVIANFDWGGVYFKTNPATLSGNTIGLALPSPAADKLFVPYRLGEGKEALLQIYDISGKSVLRTALQGSGTQELSTANLAPGIYVLQAILNGTAIAPQKIVIVK